MKTHNRPTLAFTLVALATFAALFAITPAFGAANPIAAQSVPAESVTPTVTPAIGATPAVTALDLLYEMREELFNAVRARQSNVAVFLTNTGSIGDIKAHFYYLGQASAFLEDIDRVNVRIAALEAIAAATPAVVAPVPTPVNPPAAIATATPLKRAASMPIARRGGQ